MRRGLYGGSFDPIHRGHLEPVKRAAQQLRLDRVTYLPTARPPHKSRRQASALARFVMTELALLDEPSFEVSDFELGEDEPSFTVDTLRFFSQQEPQSELFFLLGSDSFFALETWKEWPEILRLAQLAVLPRPGFEQSEMAQAVSPNLASLAANDRVHWIDTVPLSVSSTELRMSLSEGAKPLQGEVPPVVLQYLEKYSIYQ